MGSEDAVVLVRSVVAPKQPEKGQLVSNWPRACAMLIRVRVLDLPVSELRERKEVWYSSQLSLFWTS